MQFDIADAVNYSDAPDGEAMHQELEAPIKALNLVKILLINAMTGEVAENNFKGENDQIIRNPVVDFVANAAHSCSVYYDDAAEYDELHYSEHCIANVVASVPFDLWVLVRSII